RASRIPRYGKYVSCEPHPEYSYNKPELRGRTRRAEHDQRLPGGESLPGDQTPVDGAGWGEAEEDRVAPRDLLEQQGRPSCRLGRKVHEKGRPGLRGRAD